MMERWDFTFMSDDCLKEALRLESRLPEAAVNTAKRTALQAEFERRQLSAGGEEVTLDPFADLAPEAGSLR